MFGLKPSLRAACQDLQMPVHTHSGPAPQEEYGGHLGIYVTEVRWWGARPLWFALWSGVFERFPRAAMGGHRVRCLLGQ